MLQQTKALLRKNGYKLFTKAYELNIVAYRSRFIRSNQFDDEIHVFYKNKKGKWIYHIFKGTTDPGQYWLAHPQNPQGTAFLKKGQYVNGYAMGFHKGRYEALVQTKPVTVIRNYNREGLFNWITSGTEDTGNFGINIHRAFAQGNAKVIDHFSAGCLVFANAEDYSLFIQLLRKHRNIHGNRFTLTLMDFRDKRRSLYSKIAWFTLLSGGAFLVHKAYQYQQKETLYLN